MTRKAAVFLGLFVTLACMGAWGVPIVITNASPNWVHVGAPNAATWVLPSTIPDCGSENEPQCEPTGLFFGNVAWTGIQQYISMTDSAGISDIITFDSLGPNGVFRVRFWSDPNPLCCTPPPGYSLFTDVAETANGVVSDAFGICCELTGVSVTVASDGENPFRPFGVNFDVSDGISFTGATAIPEPSMGLFAGMLATTVVYLRRRRRA